MMDEVQRALSDPEPLLREMLTYYRTIAQPAIFDAHAANANGGGEHPNWQPLSPYYLASTKKSRSQHPNDILQLTGAFASDITTGSSETVEAYTRGGGQAQMLFGSSRDYPRYVGAGNGGSRQAMYITPSTANRLEEIVQHYISEVIVDARERGRYGP
jgi:hypothetical protein